MIMALARGFANGPAGGRGAAATYAAGARTAAHSGAARRQGDLVKIGCIGLGDIAQKAYLPVLTAVPGVELHLQTRTPATLHAVGDTHRVPADGRHTTLDSLLAAGLDAAFVHAPTAVHPQIVERLLEGRRRHLCRQADRV